MKLSNVKNKPMQRTVHALVLFSGGLDSILVAKILEKQGIEVTALTFVSYFFDDQQAKKSARENKISLRIHDFSKEHLKIVKNPCFGRGSGMNPCIDCHLLMLKTAKKFAAKENYNFIVTGEVLGQRPLSQNRGALELIEKKAGLAGKILRPLSEKIIHPRAELLEGMYEISGRGRKEQIELAKKFKIKNYPTPAGGCILTDKEYSKKLRELIANVKNIKASDLALLKIGRHFWTRPVRSYDDNDRENIINRKNNNKEASNGTKIILGRNHEENLKLKKMAEKRDLLIEPQNFPGPTALVLGREKNKATKIAKEKILKYAKKVEDKDPTFDIFKK